MEPSEHLFRRQSGRIVTALTRIFGLDNIALAEDVVQDVFCRALEVWKLRGVPQNPSAWLMKAARNRAIDVLRRERAARDLVPELARLLRSEWTMVTTVDALLSSDAPSTGSGWIEEDQLRMMFSCCDPQLSEDAQVALTLNLLCGFTIREIAAAFLRKSATIEKRIERGKKVLTKSGRLFDFADSELPARLSAVHRALYLLFNEGYHGASREVPVRAELCRESMRLAQLLLENARVATPETFALCALMHLHAARLPARVVGGDLVPLAQQDRSLWDRGLIARGNSLLDRSAVGSELSEYHIEAAIASLHSSASSESDTDWDRLLWLYDILLRIRPSPVIALNRAIAVAQRDGPETGIAAIRAIHASDQLASYPFLPAALGELELRAGHVETARRHFEEAAALARSPMERRFLAMRVEAALGEPHR